MHHPIIQKCNFIMKLRKRIPSTHVKPSTTYPSHFLNLYLALSLSLLHTQKHIIKQTCWEKMVVKIIKQYWVTKRIIEIEILVFNLSRLGSCKSKKWKKKWEWEEKVAPVSEEYLIGEGRGWKRVVYTRSRRGKVKVKQGSVRLGTHTNRRNEEEREVQQQ